MELRCGEAGPVGAGDERMTLDGISNCIWYGIRRQAYGQRLLTYDTINEYLRFCYNQAN